MKHVVTVDSIFDAMRLEASISGANPQQLASIRYLQSISTQIEDEYDPYKRAEFNVEMLGVNLSIILSEADNEGNLIANGEWCHMTIYPDGTTAMTTSHDPEFVNTYEPPVTGYN